MPERSFPIRKTITFLALVCLLEACGNDKSFDATAWQRGDARTRGSMAEDLVDREILLGRSAGTVEQLLGPADKDYAGALVYKIDLGWPFKDPSHYALNVYLDADRKVREARIVD